MTLASTPYSIADSPPSNKGFCRSPLTKDPPTSPAPNISATSHLVPPGLGARGGFSHQQQSAAFRVGYLVSRLDSKTWLYKDGREEKRGGDYQVPVQSERQPELESVTLEEESIARTG